MHDLRGGRLAATALAASFGACLACAALAPGAGAYVYWTNNNGTIGRANTDGTDVNQAFITGANEPFGVAVDANHVYWADYAASTIGRANIDGTNVDPDFITAVDTPRGIAVDAGHIYWTNTLSAAPDSIGRANIDGTNAVQNFIPTAEVVYDVGVNANHIYWANYSSKYIGRANLDGTGPTQTLIPTGGTPQGLAVGGDFVYWANYGMTTSTVARSRLDGSSPNAGFVPGADNPYGIALDDQYIYWVDRADAISRATLDGGTITARFIPGVDSPYDVTVDALPLPPDTDPPQTTITKAPPNKGGKPKAKYKFEADEPGATFECKLAGDGLKRSVKRFGECGSPRKYKRLDDGKFRFQVRATDAAGNVDPSPAKDKFKVVD